MGEASRVRYQVNKILKTRRKIRENILGMLAGHECRGETFRSLVGTVHANLPDNSSISFEVIADSLRHLLGTKLTDEVIDLAVWRMVGNLNVISGKKGLARPIYPWTFQPYDEWIPVQCVAYVPSRAAFDREVGARYSFRALAGQPCGMDIIQRWGPKRIYATAHQVGFRAASDSVTSNRQTVPFCHFSELVTMRFVVLIESQESKTAPVFKHMELDSACNAWNRTQLKYRGRFVHKYYCPRGYPITSPCYKCHVGYTSCRSATHRLDWVKQECESCGRDYWFDYDLSSELCIDCHRKQALKRKPKT